MKTTREIANFVGGTLMGDADRQIHGVGSLDHAGAGALAYAETGYLDRVPECRASCVLVPAGDFPERTVIVVENPRVAFARAAHWLAPPAAPFQGVHPAAAVHADAVLGTDVAIGAWTLIERGAQVGARSVLYPGCYVGAGCRIGADCILYPRVVLYPNVELGERVIVHAGAVLGADGFGFVVDGDRHVNRFRAPLMRAPSCASSGRCAARARTRLRASPRSRSLMCSNPPTRRIRFAS